MNTQNNPITQTSVLSAVSVKSVLMVLKLITLSVLGVSSVYASEALFSDSYSGRASETQLEQSPAIVRARTVSLNSNSVALDEHSHDKTQQGQIVLNLFDNVSFNAKLDQVEYRSANNYTLYGKLDGIEGEAILTFVDGVLTGNISTPKSFFQIRSAGKDQYSVSEIDQSKFPNEGTLPLPEAVLSTLSDVSSTTNEAVQPMLDDGSIVDVLVVYTTAARGTSTVTAMNSEIQAAIDQTNKAYTNSAIKHRLRLVGTMEKAYDEMGGVGTALTDVTFNMADVKTKRASLSADLVVLITKTTSGTIAANYCGQGWEMNANTPSPYKDFAFSVVPRSCATTNYSFAHVTARNLGAKPDCFVDTSIDKPYPYSHGYVSRTNGWRTIMAYKDECDAFAVTCNRIPHFSNPAVKYNGVPTGISTGTCQADIKSTFNTTALTVSQYFNGYCDLTGYVERVDVKPSTQTSNLYLRGNPLQNYYLSFTTPDVKLTNASVQALTRRGYVTIRGNQSCSYNQTSYGGNASYLYLAP